MLFHAECSCFQVAVNFCQQVTVILRFTAFGTPFSRNPTQYDKMQICRSPHQFLINDSKVISVSLHTLLLPFSDTLLVGRIHLFRMNTGYSYSKSPVCSDKYVCLFPQNKKTLGSTLQLSVFTRTVSFLSFRVFLFAPQRLCFMHLIAMSFSISHLQTRCTIFFLVRKLAFARLETLFRGSQFSRFLHFWI